MKEDPHPVHFHFCCGEPLVHEGVSEQAVLYANLLNWLRGDSANRCTEELSPYLCREVLVTTRE